MQTISPSFAAHIHKEVEKACANIEAQNRKNAELWKGVYAAGDYVLYQEALKLWESEGFKGNKPEKTAFNGAWEKLLTEKNKIDAQKQAETIAFEKQVESNLKKFVQEYKF
jgi:hypothetical protein